MKHLMKKDVLSFVFLSQIDSQKYKIIRTKTLKRRIIKKLTNFQKMYYFLWRKKVKKTRFWTTPLLFLSEHTTSTKLLWILCLIWKRQRRGAEQFFSFHIFRISSNKKTSDFHTYKHDIITLSCYINFTKCWRGNIKAIISLVFFFNELWF